MPLAKIARVCVGLFFLFLVESVSAGNLWEWWVRSTGAPGARASTFIRNIRNITLPVFNRSEFDSTRVRLVDHVGQNVIIRMPNPAIKGAFAEEEFYEGIRDVLPEGMSRDLSTRKIISFNLMHPWAEYEEYSVEKSWFEAQENREFRNYPQLGSFLSAKWLPKWARDLLVPYRRHLGLSTAEVVDDLHSEVLDQSGKPKIIVVHCVSGKDRTGMIINDYLMAYKGKSYEDVIKEGFVITGERQDVWSRTSSRWMALHRAKTLPTVGTEEEIMAFDDVNVALLPRPMGQSK
ncbi:tyrosine-protein phosphatase [Sansalvadorimonas verongulae]|uniref:tyrosine-protein phosphatase n=1 Tax=Sansalvadorimonas verongulae TaxID=2172824 RepID=UPI002E31A8D3|nr:tyrosine-protein phosphatase [Sansalvadorimonas verongulae]